MGNEDWTDLNTVVGMWPWDLPYRVSKATRKKYVNGAMTYHTIKSQEHWENIKWAFQNIYVPFATYFGRDFTANSHYRGDYGGTSGHAYGMAVDIGFKPSDELNMIKAFEWARNNLDYHQLIFEFPTEDAEHLHIHMKRSGNRNELLACSRVTEWANYLGIRTTPYGQDRGIYDHISDSTADKLVEMLENRNDANAPGKIQFVP